MKNDLACKGIKVCLDPQLSTPTKYVILHIFTFSTQAVFNLVPPDANDPQEIMCH